VALDKYPNSLE
jgi:hypothetical protein